MNVKNFAAPFAIGLLVMAGVFLLMDSALMNMQGLSLFFDK